MQPRIPVHARRLRTISGIAGLACLAVLCGCRPAPAPAPQVAPASVASGALAAAAALPASAKPDPQLAAHAEATQKARRLLQGCPLSVPDRDYPACQTAARRLIGELAKRKAVAHDVAVNVALPAVLDAVALADTATPALAAREPVALRLWAELSRPAEDAPDWRLQRVIDQLRAITRGEAGRAWSVRGRHAALEWLLDTANELADAGHDAFEPDIVCAAPPWLSDPWTFCASVWIDVAARHPSVPIEWSEEVLAAAAEQAAQGPDWAQRYWATARALATERSPRQVLLDLVLLPAVPGEVLAAFEALFDPLDPHALLLPRSATGLADDVLADARSPVAPIPAPALPLAPQPLPVPSPAIAPEVEAALPAFHALMVAYAVACEPQSSYVRKTGACGKAIATARKAGLATPTLLTHWLGQRWLPRWRALAGDVDVTHVHEHHLDLPVDATLNLAYAAHRLGEGLLVKAGRPNSDQAAALADALETLTAATALELGNGKRDLEAPDGLDTVHAWLRYLAGRPLPADLTPVWDHALAMARHRLTSGQRAQEVRAHRALNSGKLRVDDALRALQRRVLRNRWLTPSDDSDEVTLTTLRDVLLRPLDGRPYPPIDRRRVPPDRVRD